MDKVLNYVLRAEDMTSTAGGLVNLILKNCIHVTGHEISHAKFTDNGITADGRRVTVKDRILPGQTLQVILSDEPEETRVVPSEGPVEVLYEDDDLLIVNKTAGTVVHPTHGHYDDTVANHVAYYCTRKGQDAVCRLAGRLDRETSGALVFSKNRAAAGRLYMQRQNGIFSRTYLAVVQGCFSEDRKDGILTKPLEKDPGSLIRQRVAADGSGAPAVTHYRTLAQRTAECGDSRCAISLLEVRIDTGRTHQIRVHMADAGHPLLGDTLYGGSSVLPAQAGTGRKISSGTPVPRAMLHAAEVRLLQPFTGEQLHVTAPFPEDFGSLYREFGIQVYDNGQQIR